MNTAILFDKGSLESGRVGEIRMCEKRKRGRPKKENPKTSQYRLRMTNEYAELLKNMAEQCGLTKAELVREALNLYYTVVLCHADCIEKELYG